MNLEVYYFSDELNSKKWLCALVEAEIKLLPILKNIAGWFARNPG
jgi:hypothetical protein